MIVWAVHSNQQEKTAFLPTCSQNKQTNNRQTDHKTGSNLLSNFVIVSSSSTYLPPEPPDLLLHIFPPYSMRVDVLFIYFFCYSSAPVGKLCATWRTPEEKASPITVWLKLQAQVNYQAGEQEKGRQLYLRGACPEENKMKALDWNSQSWLDSDGDLQLGPKLWYGWTFLRKLMS